MGIVTVHELLNCRGKGLASSSGVESSDGQNLVVTDEEAISVDYIPAEGISGVLISPSRILVTGGVLHDERVLPFTVLRYMDFDPSGTNPPTWTTPVSLRTANTRTGRRKRPPAGDTTFPVCRMDQSMTLVPDTGMLFLIGGLKVDGQNAGKPCKSVFTFDTHRLIWEGIAEDRSSRKQAPDSILGPRFAHTAHYLPNIRATTSRARSRSAGFILIYGGYTDLTDEKPAAHVHLFDIKNSKWSLLAPADGGVPAPARAYHASILTPCNRYLVVHGGQRSHINQHHCVTGDLFVFHLETRIWWKPTVHPSSVQPPSPRIRHSVCHGVGPHSGSLLLFGGTLSNTDNCFDLFLFRVLDAEKGAANAAPMVIWESVTLRSAEVPAVPEQDKAPAEGRKRLEQNISEKTTASGTCLIAVPKLGHYVLIGGRGPVGVRESPVILQPGGAPDFAVADSVHDDDDAKAVAAVKRPTSTAAAPSAVAFEDSEPPGTTAGNRGDNPSKPKPSAVHPSSLHQNVDDRSQSPNGDGGTDDVQAGVSMLAEDEELQSSHAPPISVVDEGHNDADVGNEVVVMGDTENTVARPPSPPAPVSTDTNPSDQPVPKDIDVAVAAQTTARSRTRLRLEMEDPNDASEVQPAAKRRRSTQSNAAPENASSRTNSIATPSDPSYVASVAEKLDSPPQSDSVDKDFVTASEHGRRGRGRPRGRGRARGRGRGRGRGKELSTAAAADGTVATDEDAEKARAHASELRKKDQEICKLTENMSSLRCEKERLAVENRDLNDQVKSYVDQVKGMQLSANRLAPDRLQASPSSADSIDGTRDVATVGAKRTESGEDLHSIRVKMVGLKDRLDEASAEKENIEKHVRDLEDRNRDMDAQLSAAKNTLSDSVRDVDGLRKQEEESRKLAANSAEGEEKLRKQFRKAEEEKLMLKRDVEALRQEVQDEKYGRSEENQELTSARHMVSTVKGQVAEANKKNETFDESKRFLEMELESERKKNEEAQRLYSELKLVTQAAEERKIEVMADNERGKVELVRRIRDCEVAMKERERLREAVDAVKAAGATMSIEKTRVERELVTTRREGKMVMERVAKLKVVLKSVMPSLVSITEEMGTVLSKTCLDDIGDGLVSDGGVNLEPIAVDRDDIQAEKDRDALNSGADANGGDVQGDNVEAQNGKDSDGPNSGDGSDGGTMEDEEVRLVVGKKKDAGLASAVEANAGEAMDEVQGPDDNNTTSAEKGVDKAAVDNNADKVGANTRSRKCVPVFQVGESRGKPRAARKIVVSPEESDDTEEP